jgi:hypothetical protein
MRFRPANIRLINRRQNPPRLLLALSLKNNKSEGNDKNSPIDVQKLTRHSISVLHVQPGRSSFDPAQQQMLDRVEADGAQLQGVFDGASYFFDGEGLQQAQHLHILPAAVLVEPLL